MGAVGDVIPSALADYTMGELLDPQPQRIRLELIRMPRSIPAGMNFVRIGAIVDTLRHGGEVHHPAEVRREGDGWRITDGRHRYVASHIAGVADLLCVEVP